ncbi:uncharacterized protein EI97DRAFT_454948 [Westerdykella ornata]|uniref:Uncharacterized protein n=1 Tax=Westerdykella ornata TaxID=318751 RepID=A0A6A6JTQ6_WESOR|nr:uncharacterized protein EI97DRAFT_454948 [Westerdykella ornata]KAF2280010.1 hypothetical protein EI97DRAFT_454948 [Westerdykella ornata]
MSHPTSANGPSPLPNSEYNFIPYPPTSLSQRSMSDYARTMHEHTRRQLDSAQRKCQEGARGTESPPDSLNHSVRSTDS